MSRWIVHKSDSGSAKPWIVIDTLSDPCGDAVLYHFASKRKAIEFRAVLKREAAAKAACNESGRVAAMSESIATLLTEIDEVLRAVNNGPMLLLRRALVDAGDEDGALIVDSNRHALSRTLHNLRRVSTRRSTQLGDGKRQHAEGNACRPVMEGGKDHE